MKNPRYLGSQFIPTRPRRFLSFSFLFFFFSFSFLVRFVGRGRAGGWGWVYRGVGCDNMIGAVVVP